MQTETDRKKRWSATKCVRKTTDRKADRRCEFDQNLRQKAYRAINKCKNENGWMELVLTQNYPVG